MLLCQCQGSCQGDGVEQNRCNCRAFPLPPHPSVKTFFLKVKLCPCAKSCQFSQEYSSYYYQTGTRNLRKGLSSLEADSSFSFETDVFILFLEITSNGVRTNLKVKWLSVWPDWLFLKWHHCWQTKKCSLRRLTWTKAAVQHIFSQIMTLPTMYFFIFHPHT